MYRHRFVGPATEGEELIVAQLAKLHRLWAAIERKNLAFGQGDIERGDCVAADIGLQNGVIGAVLGQHRPDNGWINATTAVVVASNLNRVRADERQDGIERVGTIDAEVG